MKCVYFWMLYTAYWIYEVLKLNVSVLTFSVFGRFCWRRLRAMFRADETTSHVSLRHLRTDLRPQANHRSQNRFTRWETTNWHTVYNYTESIQYMLVSKYFFLADLTYDDFVNELSEAEGQGQCRYAVFDAEYRLTDGQKRSKLVFIYWCVLSTALTCLHGCITAHPVK